MTALKHRGGLQLGVEMSTGHVRPSMTKQTKVPLCPTQSDQSFDAEEEIRCVFDDN